MKGISFLIISFVFILIGGGGALYYYAIEPRMHQWIEIDGQKIPWYCESSDDIQRFQIVFGADAVRQSVDFNVYIPNYIPASIKQTCPINARLAYEDHVDIFFHAIHLNTDGLKNRSDYILEALVGERGRRSGEDLDQLKSRFPYHEEVALNIGDGAALLIFPETNPNVNPETIVFFIGDTLISIQSVSLSREEYIKMANSFVLL